MGGGGGEHSMQGDEMLPALAMCSLALGMRGDEPGHFHEVKGMSIVVDLYKVHAPIETACIMGRPY